MHVQVMYHVTGSQLSARYVQRACENRFVPDPAESLHARLKLGGFEVRPDLPVISSGQATRRD